MTSSCFEQNQRLNPEETHQDKGKKNTSEDSFTYVAFILTKLLKTQRERESLNMTSILKRKTKRHRAENLETNRKKNVSKILKRRSWPMNIMNSSGS